MRKNWKSMTALCMACGLAMTQMTGCGGADQAIVETKETAQEPEKEPAGEKTEEESKPNETKDALEDVTKGITEPGTVTVTLGEGGDKSVTYEPEDLDASWDAEQATGIVFSESDITVDGEGARADGNTVIIEKAGTYVVSGTRTDGQIRIEADRDELVHLVLNGAELSNKSTSPIYSPEKCKVVMTLEAGTKNVISDADAYQFEDGEDEPDAAIFTKGDLTINGTGALEVNGTYACAIRSKDDLKVVSGVLNLNSADDALKGKDSVVIGGGELHIISGGDGVKSNNDEDLEKGYVWIDGGKIVIEAESDGIQAEHALVINGGSIEITKSEEALEGKSVDILGGQIKAVSSDDGINSAGPAETEREKMQDQDGVYTRIAGGQIWLDASADGIDSNGDLYIDGGEIYLTTPTVGDASIIDYNGTSRITGGIVIAAGGTSMMQYFGEESTQNYLVNYYDEIQAGGTQIQLTDIDGNVLASYAPEHDFTAVIISTPDLEKDSTYKIVTGETSVDAVISDVRTEIGEAKQMGGFGGRGGHGPRPEGGEFPEGMTPPERGERPEGMTPPEKGERPEGIERGERPDGKARDLGGKKPGESGSVESEMTAEE
ncbi:MAG: carbohydrate-binding domain-containing protein [Brotaphodocola sp.]